MGRHTGRRVKITKCQLRRIVKEEKQKLHEAASLSKAEEDLYASIDAYVDALDESMGHDIDDQVLKAEVLNFVDGYFEDTAYAAKEYRQDSGEEPGFMLPTPKEDPMGRGAKTSALRRSVMRK